jgi:hypothetical protein
MIRIERLSLPDGLRAIARRDENGDLVIYVSKAIDARRQRAAVMEAIRASRRAGWRAGLPIGIALLAGLRLSLRRAATAIHAQPAAWTGAAVAGVAAVVGASVLLSASPGPHSPAASAQPPVQGGSTSLPSQRPGGRAARPPGSGQVRPVAAIPATSPAGSGGGQPQSGQSSPVSRQTPPGSTGGPAPTSPTSGAPSPTPPAPAPTPTPTSAPPSSAPQPSPSPSKGQPGTCVGILSIRVCVPLRITVSL